MHAASPLDLWLDCTLGRRLRDRRARRTCGHRSAPRCRRAPRPARRCRSTSIRTAQGHPLERRRIFRRRRICRAQAARGEKVYDQTCGTCHQPGQFVGQEFVESWNDRRVYDFYSLVRGTMPLDNPGGLKDQEYLDVVAYLLQANHARSPKRRFTERRHGVACARTKIAVHLP